VTPSVASRVTPTPVTPLTTGPQFSGDFLVVTLLNSSCLSDAPFVASIAY